MANSIDPDETAYYKLYYRWIYTVCIMYQLRFAEL